MGLGELATLREYDIPLVVIVLVDESLTLIASYPIWNNLSAPLDL